MTKRATGAIYAKEIKDILRDRRTVVSAILVPILIIPVLFLGIGSFAERQVKSLQEKPSSIGWIGNSDAAGAKAVLAARPNVQIIDQPGDTTVAFEALRNKGFDAVVVVPDDFDNQLDRVLTGTDSLTPNLQVFVDETREKSGLTARIVISIAEEARLRKVESAFSSQGLRSEMMRPFSIERLNVASEEKTGRAGLASFLPYFLILMVLSGATYPAIDMTAGEKERGTLETLLVSGVSRADIVLGKFLTVVTISLITAALNMASMALTFNNAATISPVIASEFSIRLNIGDMALLLLTIIPLAVIFSAGQMVIALFAKSYREAQTYVMPMMFVVIFASMTSMMPGEPSPWMSLVPVMNVAMLLKQSLVGHMDMSALLITTAANLVLAFAALYLVFNMFRRESVLFRI